MAFPDQYLRDPQWHSKPIEEREQDLMRADPQFATFPSARRRSILEKASQKYGRSQTPQHPQQPKQPQGIIGRSVEDLSIGFRSGEAGLAHSASVVTKPFAPGFSKSAEEFSRGKAPTQEEMVGHTGVGSQVLQGIGAAPAQILKYAPAQAAGKYAPLVAGGIGFVTNLDKGPAEAAKEGIKDAVMFAGMGKTAKLPTVAKRALGSAAVSAATTAAFEGGNPSQIASSAVLGGAFGAMGGKKKEASAMTPEQAKGILEGGVGAVEKAHDFIRKMVAPQNRGPEAKREALIIRAKTSDIYRQADVAEYALRQASKSFRLMPDDQRLKIIHAIETGAKQEDPKIQGFVDTMRSIHNQVRDELIAEGTREVKDPLTGVVEKKPTILKTVKEAIEGEDDALRAYYENYFPHLFKDPDKAAALVRSMYVGKRPLEGPATFLHQRKYPTIEEALSVKDENGKPALELVTTDPVEAYMLKWREMKRFTSALRISKDMEADGLLQWESPGKRGPQGWVKIQNSKAFRRMAKEDSGELKLAQEGWAPEPAARVINNYLSPGLRSHEGVGGAFRAVIGFNNVLNQAQLGLSAFHLGFTSVDSVNSRFALGIEQMVEGARRGNVKTAAKGAVSMAKAVTILPALVDNLRTGSDMVREWRKPGSSNRPETAQLVQMMQEAGGGMSLDPVYRTHMTRRVFESMRQHGSYIGMLFGDPLSIPKQLLALNEQFGNLVMNKFVPMQKLGVFADLARFEMERLPEGAPIQQVRSSMSKAWDSVDNRMGMLRYDNLFWEKWIKDMSMATFRSVGWNIGTLRELGGGVSDWGKLGKAFIKGTNKEFTHRMAYTLALPAVTGLMGGMIHYAYNGKAPEEMRDWFFPRTGRKDEFGRDERISIPSYVKDSYHILSALGDVARGRGGGAALAWTSAKLHSTWGTIGDMLANKDFYNTEIANSDDPMMKRALDYTTFLIKQYSPFSWSNIAREYRLGFQPSEMAGTFFGFLPAPADIKKTSAERLATTLAAQRLPRSANTREERDRQVNRRELERRMRTESNWQQYAQQQLEAGTISQDDLYFAADRAAGLPLDRTFRRMRISDALKVWEVASDEEKQRLRPIFKEKVERNSEQIMSLPAKERTKVARQILQILNEPTASAPPGGAQ